MCAFVCVCVYECLCVYVCLSVFVGTCMMMWVFHKCCSYILCFDNVFKSVCTDLCISVYVCVYRVFVCMLVSMLACGGFWGVRKG